MCRQYPLSDRAPGIQTPVTRTTEKLVIIIIITREKLVCLLFDDMWHVACGLHGVIHVTNV